MGPASVFSAPLRLSSEAMISSTRVRVGAGVSDAEMAIEALLLKSGDLDRVEGGGRGPVKPSALCSSLAPRERPLERTAARVVVAASASDCGRKDEGGDAGTLTSPSPPSALLPPSPSPWKKISPTHSMSAKPSSLPSSSVDPRSDPAPGLDFAAAAAEGE